jgi:VanZ family protein
MGGIYYFSDQPNSNKISEDLFGSFNYFVRKSAHVTEYAVLFFLSLWFRLSCMEDDGAPAEVETSKLQRFFSKCTLPILFSVLYACSDEWHQSFVPGRSSLVSDVFIDSAGILIASVLAWIFAV